MLVCVRQRANQTDFEFHSCVKQNRTEFHEHTVSTLGINISSDCNSTATGTHYSWIEMFRMQSITALLLATDFGVMQYRRSSLAVNAFGNSPICVSCISARRTVVSLKGTNVDETFDHLLLLDESVMLYSQLKKGHESGGLHTQRESELTSLIEDVVLGGNGIRREESTTVTENKSETNSDDTVKETAADEALGLEEITLALDEQILLGSQTTFSEEELEAWVERIDSLRDQLTQLTSLPPSSPSPPTTPSESTVTPPPALDQLRTRLESMRTSIASEEGTQQ